MCFLWSSNVAIPLKQSSRLPVFVFCLLFQTMMVDLCWLSYTPSLKLQINEEPPFYLDIVGFGWIFWISLGSLSATQGFLAEGVKNWNSVYVLHEAARVTFFKSDCCYIGSQPKSKHSLQTSMVMGPGRLTDISMSAEEGGWWPREPLEKAAATLLQPVGPLCMGPQTELLIF